MGFSSGGTAVSRSLRRLRRESRAQGLAEYGIALAIIGAGAGLAALGLARHVAAIWSVASSVIRLAATGG